LFSLPNIKKGDGIEDDEMGEVYSTHGEMRSA